MCNENGNFEQILRLCPILSVWIMHWRQWWSATLWFLQALPPTSLKCVPPVVSTSTLHCNWFRWTMAVIHWQRRRRYWKFSLDHLVAPGGQLQAMGTLSTTLSLSPPSSTFTCHSPFEVWNMRNTENPNPGDVGTLVMWWLLHVAALSWIDTVVATNRATFVTQVTFTLEKWLRVTLGGHHWQK